MSSLSSPPTPTTSAHCSSPTRHSPRRLPGSPRCHRPDVYPDPFGFRPERFLGRQPGTYTWIPFGGGIRRCLGASLAMIEQQIVLRTIARRTDMVAPDPRPEHARQRNVTMIPDRGAQVVVTARR